jgi:HK97 family phage major capsid protein
MLQNPRIGEPDMLLGIPVYLSTFAPATMTTDDYVAVLGDFSTGYQIVDVGMMEMEYHKDSTLSAAGQVGFIGKMYTSGAVIDEGAFRRIKLSA